MIAHLPGGYLCTHEIPLSTGINIVAAAIHLALGEEPEAAALRPRWTGGVARRHFFPSPGTVVAVRGIAEAATGEGVALLEVGVVPGARVSGMTSRMRPAGVVIAVGDTREQAVARADAAVLSVARMLLVPSVFAEGILDVDGHRHEHVEHAAALRQRDAPLCLCARRTLGSL